MRLTDSLSCSVDRHTHDALTLATACCIDENKGSEVLLLILQALQEAVDSLDNETLQEAVMINVNVKLKYMGLQDDDLYHLTWLHWDTA